MAGKAPGPRRLDEDEVGKLDAKVVVIQEGPLDGCLRKADQVADLMPQEDVHQKMFPMMSTDLSKVRLAIDAGLQDALHIAVLNFSMSKVTLPMTKMDMSHCGGMVMSSAGRPRTDEPALLPREIKMGSSEFLRGEF